MPIDSRYGAGVLPHLLLKSSFVRHRHAVLRRRCTPISEPAEHRSLHAAREGKRTGAEAGPGRRPAHVGRSHADDGREAVTAHDASDGHRCDQLAAGRVEIHGCRNDAFTLDHGGEACSRVGVDEPVEIQQPRGAGRRGLHMLRCHGHDLQCCRDRCWRYGRRQRRRRAATGQQQDQRPTGNARHAAGSDGRRGPWSGLAALSRSARNSISARTR